MGFECKTSDKLSRRAYPRGYTETLEDRIRQLEAENNKLMGLLDLKDEQMEMINRVSSVMNRDKSQERVKQESTPILTNKTAPAPANATTASKTDEETYTVRLPKIISADGSYRGASAGGAFLKVVRSKIETKHPKVLPLVQRLITNLSRSSDYDIFHPPSSSPPYASTPRSVSFYESDSVQAFLGKLLLPPMVITDRLVSTYFNEWHPLNPVLDHLQFLTDYRLFNELIAATSVETSPAGFRRLEQHYASRMSVGIKYFATNLLLVCSLAAHFISEQIAETVNISELERNWRYLLDHPEIIMPSASPTASLGLLTSYNLGLLYSLHTHAIDDIWKYKSLAVAACMRMGLYRDQAGLIWDNGTALRPYDREMRQRLFWNTFVLDCFVTSVLGTNQSFDLNEVQCAIPTVSDENLPKLRTQEQVQAKQNDLSCFIQLIEFCKVLCQILRSQYSLAHTTQSYKTTLLLGDQLESWRRAIPAEFKFDFPIARWFCRIGGGR